jgi:hypothetical protein
MSSVYQKEVLVKGRPTLIRCVDAGDVTLALSGRFPRIATVEDEWFQDLRHPQAAVDQLQSMRDVGVDVLTFWNQIPNSTPQFDYPFETAEIAVLPIHSYEDWWQNRIKSRTRNLIRKSEKQGLVVREMGFDEEFVRGMTAIFNEQPIRQGRRFWHYGKDVDTVRRQFSRFIHRESMIGAFVDNEMVGFIMLGWAGKCGYMGQILSKVAERERNPNNALMAKAVEVCARRGVESLVYGFWGDTSLAEFKRRCGFEPVSIPHYFVPLSRRGELALRCGLHRGWSSLIPPGLLSRLRQWRAAAYAWRSAQ